MALSVDCLSNVKQHMYGLRQTYLPPPTFLSDSKNFLDEILIIGGCTNDLHDSDVKMVNMPKMSVLIKFYRKLKGNSTLKNIWLKMKIYV